MTRSKFLPALAVPVLLIGLAACGSESEAPAASPKPPSTTATTATTAPPTAPEPTTTSTTPSATPSAPATTSAPAGKLIDYETDDDSGATIVAAADTAKLTGAPADFKTFIAARLAAAEPR
jgi:hypothetical protein